MVDNLSALFTTARCRAIQTGIVLHRFEQFNPYAGVAAVTNDEWAITNLHLLLVIPLSECHAVGSRLDS